MPATFKGKVVLVTGAGSGIGRATAIKLASLGATLYISDINEASVGETATLCRAESNCDACTFSLLDVSSSEACGHWAENAVSQHQRIDGLFNCAGINPTYKKLGMAPWVYIPGFCLFSLRWIAMRKKFTKLLPAPLTVRGGKRSKGRIRANALAQRT